MKSRKIRRKVSRRGSTKSLTNAELTILTGRFDGNRHGNFSDCHLGKCSLQNLTFLTTFYSSGEWSRQEIIEGQYLPALRSKRDVYEMFDQIQSHFQSSAYKRIANSYVFRSGFRSRTKGWYFYGNVWKCPNPISWIFHFHFSFCGLFQYFLHYSFFLPMPQWKSIFFTCPTVIVGKG